MKKTPIILGLVCLLAFFGCGESKSEGNDAGQDGGQDAGDDAGADMGPDEITDAGGDEGGDEGQDGGEDGGDDQPRTWRVEVVEDAPAFKSRAAVDVGPDGIIQVVYNIATEDEGWYTPDVWYAKKSGDTWERTLAAAAGGISNEFPNLVVDSQNKPHIFYNRYVEADDQIDIFYVTTNDQGQFVAPVNLTSTADVDEYGPDVAMDSAGDIHLLFQESVFTTEYQYSIGYMKMSSGSIESVADPTAAFSLSPDYSIAIADDGTVHTVYCKTGSLDLNNVLYLRRRTSTGWENEIPITEIDLDVWSPSLDVDQNDVVHLAYTKSDNWSEKTLYYNQVVGTQTAEQALSTSLEDRSYYLGLEAETDGTVHIAFYRSILIPPDDYRFDVFYISGIDNVFGEEERLTETPTMDESYTGMAVGPGGMLVISFVENLSDAPNGKVYCAIK